MVVILNASASSTARDPSTRSKVSALFGAAGAYPRIIVAEGKDVQAIVRPTVAANEKTIVAGGGDGTVSTIGAERTVVDHRVAAVDVGEVNCARIHPQERSHQSSSTGRDSRSILECAGHEC